VVFDFDQVWILLILTKNSTNLVVSLALICSFLRMRSQLGLGDVKVDGIPENIVKVVVDSLRSSDFLKISEDGLYLWCLILFLIAESIFFPIVVWWVIIW